MRPIVFLDIDGVLNSRRYFERIPSSKVVREERGEADRRRMIDPQAMERLNRLLSAIAADVVISSAWRVGESTVSMQKFLESVGFLGNVIGLTPAHGSYRGRGKEIEAWLRDTQGAGDHSARILVIDDDDDIDPFADRHLHTRNEIGLTDADVLQGIAMMESA